MPVWRRHTEHCPSVQHEQDSTQETRGAPGFSLLEEELESLLCTDDHHHTREEEDL